MNWELFVDESGSFKAKEPCVVGGFLCPAGTVTEQITEEWKKEILSMPEIQKLQYPTWIYDHCCENNDKSESKSRWKIQVAVLKEYKRKITSLGGSFILMTCPKRYYNQDNTTNFLSVFAKGLMMLYEYLKQAGTLDSLKVHAAQRTDNTYLDYQELEEVSPTTDGPGSTYICGKRYQNQILNLAFLHGGSQLINDPVFLEMVKNIEIIPDRYAENINRTGNYILKQDGKYHKLPDNQLGTGNYDRLSHPLTVPADYICNSFQQKTVNPYSPVLHQLNEIYMASEHIIILPTEQPFLPTSLFPNGFTVTGDVLMSLFSSAYPSQDASRFIRVFNKCPVDQQHSVIQSMVDALRPYIRDSIDFYPYITRLQAGIDFASQITDPEIRNFFIANFLLYQRSLYTHLGDHENVKRTNSLFELALQSMDDGDDIDRLHDIAGNQTIVDYTDEFRYDDALLIFMEAEDYWNNRIRLSRKKEPCYPLWGKTIGSYLQLLTHQLHRETNPVRRSEYWEDFLKIQPQACHHLDNAFDLSRYHQNVCDLYAENGSWNKAFDHLYQAVLEQNVSDSQLTVRDAEKVVNALIAGNQVLPLQAYKLQHYVRLLSAIYLKEPDSSEAETLLSPLLQEMTEAAVHTISQSHPRTQIMWKYASTLASRVTSTIQERDFASRLFSMCHKELTDMNQPIFHAIAVGVCAELAWHINKGHLKRDLGHALKSLNKSYKDFLLTKPSGMLDPFFPYLKGEELSPNQACNVNLLQLSFEIGY